MTNLERRHFLQFAGGTLANIGLSQFHLIARAEQAARVWAQPTGRKLALLIGINQYPSGIPALNGCLTDVEMQYELLRHRYGFKPADILTLTTTTSEKPTRDNILAAFESHLIQQAKPGDVVVFHYSGHGGLVTDPDPLNHTNLNGTLIPADCTLEKRNDIMGRTLFLLSSQIQTDYFTMVLDSCHSGGGLRGNQVVRALPRSSLSRESPPSPSRAELQYQQKQLQKLGWSRSEFQSRRRQGIAKGVAIGSTTQDWLALDANFGDFYAGALTYLLTRYLWQLPVSEPLSTTFDRLALITQELAAASGNPQIPIKEVAPGQPFAHQSMYQLAAARPPAEAVVRKIMTDGTIVFWLGGVSSRALDAFQPGSLFSMVDEVGNVIGEIEQTRRIGLEGYGMLKSGQVPPIGTLLREKLRNLPMELVLKIGLDNSLGLDREIIAEELRKTARIKIVPVNQKEEVNFILGRLTNKKQRAGAIRGINVVRPEGSIGLFTAGEIPVPSSFGFLGERPQSIVARLRPQLKMLQARQLLNLTLNGEASQLKIDIELKSRRDGNVQVIARGGSRFLEATDSPKPYKANSIVDIQVFNGEENLVYLAMLAIGDDGAITILHPANWDSPESAPILQPQAKTTVPMEIYGPPGFFEILVFTSLFPLRDTLRALQSIARSRGLRSNQNLTFDGGTRSADDVEDIVWQTTRSLVNDMTNHPSAKASNEDEISQGLNTKYSGVFSATLEVID